MQCQTCGKLPATVHEFRVLYPDQTGAPEVQIRQTHLCPPCAKTAGIPMPAGIPSGTQLVSLLGKAILAPLSAAAQAKAQDLKCPDCGWTWRDFRQTSRFGCPNDYAVFAEQLPELLDRLHGQSEHAASEEEARLARLQREMQEAAEREDYETAARIRDRIRALEAELEAPGPAPEAPSGGESPPAEGE